MISLVLHALRARRVQTFAMVVLAALASLGASAAPWFAGWGRDAVASAAATTAPAAQRLVVFAGQVGVGPGPGNPLDVARSFIDTYLSIPGSEGTVGARVFVTVAPGEEAGGAGTVAPGEEAGGAEPGEGPGAAAPDDESESAESETVESETVESESGAAPDRDAAAATQESIDLYLVTRANVCEHLHLVVGRCPVGAGEVALPTTLAADLGVAVGDPVEVQSSRLAQGSLRVSGLYEIAHPHESYWVGTTLFSGENPAGRRTDPAVVSEQTLVDLQPSSVDLEVHLLLPPAAFVDPALELRTRLDEGRSELRQLGLTPVSSVNVLLSQIARDRLLVVAGVSVGAGQLVLLSWVGLFLAVRHTSEERRADIGLLRLRGAPTRRVWAYVALSSGIPMITGTLVGALGGVVAVAAVAGRLDPERGPLAAVRTIATDPLDSLWLSLVAAVAAGLGGLAAAIVAEWRALRAPVVSLLRRVLSGRRGWRADLLDLVVVVVAAAGVYQGWGEARHGEGPSALVLLTPALVGLAAALLVARALPPVAARLGIAALRSGRVGWALAALQLARRPGNQRVFAVLAVAAAVFTTMTVGWQSASAAWHQRAVQELGADRVLTVEAPSAAALLSVVRSVDPDGRYAMAVATILGTRVDERVVAIDTPRYPTVGRQPTGLPVPPDLAAILRPVAVDAPVVRDGALTLDATAADVPVGLRVHLSTVDGQARFVDYPTLATGRTTSESAVEGCAPSCRLVALEVLIRGPSPEPVTVEIHALSQSGAAVLDGRRLGDIARWRTTLAQVVPATLGASEAGLAITAPAGPVAGPADARALVLTTPVPLPLALAGPPPRPADGPMTIPVLGGTEVPYVVAARLPVLPVVGDRGMLVDLEYALLSNESGAGSAELSVWLTADAPDALVTALARHGVTVRTDQSAPGRAAELASQGPGLALLFSYLTVVVVLLLAAGVAFISSTVDRHGRVAELVALRGQGLSVRALRTAVLAGTAVMMGAAALTGVVAAVVADGLVSAGLPVFADDWRLLPAPGLTLGSVLVAVGVIVVVFGVASLTGAARLVAATAPGGAGATTTERNGHGRHRAGHAGERADAKVGRS